MEENKNSTNQNPNPENKAPQAKPGPSNARKAPKKEEKKEKKSSGVGTVIMIIMLVGLLGAVGFMVFRDQEKAKVILAKQTEIDTLGATIELQLKQLDEERAKVEQWKARAGELQLNIDSLEAMIVSIDELKSKLKKSEGRAWYYRNEVKKISDKANSIGLVVDSLRKVNELALLKIDTLNQEKEILGDTINRIKEEKVQLSEKVALASIMRGESFSIVGFNHKGKEYDRDEYKSKHLDKLKLTFYLSENKVAPKNDKELVMRLVEPDGTVLFSGTDGGSFETAEGDEQMYTLSQFVKFDGVKQKVVFMYQKGNDYKSGKHKIEVYADGHKIGETFFKVK